MRARQEELISLQILFFIWCLEKLIKNILNLLQILDIFDTHSRVLELSETRQRSLQPCFICFGETSVICTVVLYSTIWPGPHKTSWGLWKIWSSRCLQSTHCATVRTLPLSSIIRRLTIFGCRWCGTTSWGHIWSHIVSFSFSLLASFQGCWRDRGRSPFWEPASLTRGMLGWQVAVGLLQKVLFLSYMRAADHVSLHLTNTVSLRTCQCCHDNKKHCTVHLRQLSSFYTNCSLAGPQSAWTPVRYSDWETV